jgi:hypothetical protein
MSGGTAALEAVTPEIDGHASPLIDGRLDAGRVVAFCILGQRV